MYASMRRRRGEYLQTSTGELLSNLYGRSFTVSSLLVDTSLVSAVLPRTPFLVIAPSAPSPAPLHVLWLTSPVLSSTRLQTSSPFSSTYRFYHGSEISYQKGQSMTPGAHKSETRSDGGTGDTYFEGCFGRHLHAPAGPVLQGIRREANINSGNYHGAGHLSAIFEDPI